MDIKSIFEKNKTLITVILSVFLILYFAFLFVVPNAVNLNNYKEDIQKLVEENTKLNLEFDNLKIITTPLLKAGVNIKGAKLSYPDGSTIVKLEEGEVKISLLPLIFKTVQVSDVSADSPVINLVILKNGQLDVLDFINKNLPAKTAENNTSTAELPVKISDKLPVVKIKNYSFNIKDEKNNASAALKGNNFVFDDAVMNKHFRVASDGSIHLNNMENIRFDVKLKSFFPVIASSETQTNQTLPQIDIFKELVKYNPKANISADLNIKEHDGHTDVHGYLNADKISLNLNGTRLPDSYFHLNSSGHNTVVESDIYISSQEKAQLYSKISHGCKTKIDLNLKTDKISFTSIKDFAAALMNSLNIQNDLASVNTQGGIKADFKIKTDLKNFESSGFLNISDGVLSHKTVPVYINGIAADIDFSDNSVNINKAQAFVNGTNISAKGTVDSKSNTDISLNSGNINIAPLFNAFAPADIKKTCVLKSGIFSVDAALKGRLDNIQPSLNAGLKNFVLSTKSPMPLIRISISNAKVKVDPKDIKIVPFSVIFNSSKINVSGGVYDYLNKMNIDVKADGSISASDLKNLLPKEARAIVGSKGAIPVKASICGNDKKIEFASQAFTDSNNHFSPLSVKKMLSKQGLVNVHAVYSGDRLTINDASLYQSLKSAFTENFADNKKGASKIAGLTGEIADVSSSHPMMNLNFSLPEPLILSSVVMPSASLKARGDLNISGDVNTPDSLVYKGFFSVKDISLPDLLTKVQDADIEFNGNTLTAKIQNLDINGTPLNIDTEAYTRFTNVFLIKTMKISSSNFDADKLFKAMDKMNALTASSGAVSVSTSAASPVLPVKITDGDLNIQKFVMKQVGGNLNASDITGDFTLQNDLFRLENLKASAFGGNISGVVTYNLKNTAVTAKINGSKIDANPAVTVFAALKDQMMGKVDFDADVKLKGATYEQQMKSLNGKVQFSLKDGQMGSLGRFETFLKADNLLSQSFVSTGIGSLIAAVAPYNTGKFAYLNGDLNIKNGVAFLSPVKMSGPHMSLLLTGNVNILSMVSSIEILGSLSPEVEKALGPVADLSVEKFASFIPKFGAKIASALNTYNAAANKTELDKIPALTPSKSGTKSFKVVLNGNLNNPPSAIKRFQWLNTPEKIKEEQTSLEEAVSPKLPASKEELKEMIKEDVKQGVANAVKNNEKVQELQKNKAVKTLGDIYNFYKKSGTKTNGTAQPAAD